VDAGKESIRAESAFSSIAPERVLDLCGEIPDLYAVAGVDVGWE